MRLIDMHAHLWIGHGVEKCRRKILKSAEVYGVESFFVSTLVRAVPSPDEVTLANQATYDFARDYPELIKSYVYLSPEHDNALDVLRRGVEDNGAIGAKIWISEKCDATSVNPLAEQLIDYGLPVLIHTFKKSNGPQAANESTSVNVRNLALRYPELKIIMAHIDGNCYNGVENVRDLSNVWVDVSGSPSRAGEVEYAVRHLGSQRVMFGTDLSACSFAIPYGKVIEAKISDSDKENILYKNTVRLFDKLYAGEVL